MTTKTINKDQLGKDLKSILEVLEVKVNAETGKKIVEGLFDTITDYMANGDKISIHGFGDFGTKVRAARKGRNPQSGEEIEIAEKTVPTFTAKKKLKDSVEGKI